MKKNIYLLLALIVSLPCIGQIKLEVNIPNYAQQIISIYEYEDYYTNHERLIHTLETNKEGTFKCELSIDKIKKIIIKTSNTSAFFYAEPDSSYLLSFGKSDTNAAQTLGSEIAVSIYFLNKNEQSLNNQIIYFENLLSTFYANNNIYFAQPRILQQELLNFKQNTLKKEFVNASTFLKNYISYSIAPIEEACFLNYNYQFKNYFSKQILYDHPMYMNYFTAYYRQYLKQLSLKPSGINLHNDINEMHSYEKTMDDLLKADTLLKNDSLRELVLLTGLREWYYLKDNNRNSISLIMNYIALKGIHTKNRIIAKNLLEDMNALDAGSAAPEIVLNDKKYKSIADLKGNYVYINFWATWDVGALQELKYIQKLEQKYGHRVIFISIATGENVEAEKQYFITNKFNWILIHDTDKSIRSNYHVKNIPFNVLIDTEGDIIKGNAPNASKNMDNFFKQLIRKK